MQLGKILKAVEDFFTESIAPPFKIPSIKPSEEGKGWEVIVEVIEEKEYMKAHAKDEMVGIYQVHVNEKLEVVSFERQGLRARSAI